MLMKLKIESGTKQISTIAQWLLVSLNLFACALSIAAVVAYSLFLGVASWVIIHLAIVGPLQTLFHFNQNSVIVESFLFVQNMFGYTSSQIVNGISCIVVVLTPVWYIVGRAMRDEGKVSVRKAVAVAACKEMFYVSVILIILRLILLFISIL